MARHPGPIRRLWYNWKMMQLPWRRKWLVGFDLEGNTFWEFKDALHAGRHRRIVKYGRWAHHSDVQVPPQWMQWLRHTRYEPPSLVEQQSDVFRQERIKVLAAQADARWAAKPSYLDAPDKRQPIQMLESRDQNTGISQTNIHQELEDRAKTPRMSENEDDISDAEQASHPPALTTRTVRKEPKPQDSPWKQQAKGNPGDEWQPDSWTPAPAKRRA